MGCGPVSLERHLQFVHPSSLPCLQSCFQVLFDCFVDRFNLPISLRVVDGGETLLDSQRLAKLGKLLAGELGSIVVTIC